MVCQTIRHVFLNQNHPLPQLASVSAQELEDKIQIRGNVIQALASLPVSSLQDAALISSALAQSTVRLSTIKAHGKYSTNHSLTQSMSATFCTSSTVTRGKGSSLNTDCLLCVMRSAGNTESPLMRPKNKAL